MTINCVVGGSYSLNRSSISAPKGDTVVQRFALFDGAGQEYDTAAVTSVTFSVAEGQWHGGSVYAGGDLLFSRTLGNGIVKSPDLYSLVVTVPPVNTAAIENIYNYYELVIGTSGGASFTVSSGLLMSNRTIRADGF